MKRRLSAQDFELAWRLRPESWSWRGLKEGYEKEMAKRVLVDGEAIKNVCDYLDLESNKPFEDDKYVGHKRLSDTVRQIYEQLFVTVG